ncbi:MAG: nuclear transport factor 2 family protein [Methylobacteriaceae bacterium]|nr:nuclear transport factor 2 family protein [Methylobacteriaceae bacterium]MBV9395657.1 nuclear transport factor 2 family protein [Methylobacteriaceae bacterium]
MTNANEVAEAYLNVWNERDRARRESLIANGWTEGAIYVDPLMRGTGRSEIAELIGAVQERFPDFRFGLLGKPDGFGANVRFSWGLGPVGGEPPIKGTDFVTLENGRFDRVIGFLDEVPAA